MGAGPEPRRRTAAAGRRAATRARRGTRRGRTSGGRHAGGDCGVSSEEASDAGRGGVREARGRGRGVAPAPATSWSSHSACWPSWCGATWAAQRTPPRLRPRREGWRSPPRLASCSGKGALAESRDHAWRHGSSAFAFCHDEIVPPPHACVLRGGVATAVHTWAWARRTYARAACACFRAALPQRVASSWAASRGVAVVWRRLACQSSLLLARFGPARETDPCRYCTVVYCTQIDR